MSDHKHDHHESHEHHILPTSTALGIGAILLILTAVTVWVAGIDFGRWNLVVALAVATIKALLVCLFFMNLLYDKKENGLIFATSFLFLAIFIVLLSTDVFFRGPVKIAKGTPLFMTATSNAKPTFKKPWIATEELRGRGGHLYAENCATCHGDQGMGNGPASGTLNPKPRNFTAGDGWKNGRKVTDVFKTLTEGLGGMPAFASFSAEDKWAVTHYVLALGPSAPAASPADFAAVKIDPNTDFGGEAATAKSIPIDIAIELVVRDAKKRGTP